MSNEKKQPRTATESSEESKPNPGDPGFEQPNQEEGATIGQRAPADDDPASGSEGESKR